MTELTQQRKEFEAETVKQIDRMAREVALLAMELARLDAAESENERLREQLEDAQIEIERLRGPIE